MIQAIVTDIEGTTSSISFVKDVLFPFAHRALPAFVEAYHDDPQVRAWLDAAAADMGGSPNDEQIVATLQQWIEEDRKHTALKALQGRIWQIGYESGEFTGHVYPDAGRMLAEWHGLGIPVYVFSSGSAQAQELLFQYSDFGDMARLMDGYFDTTIGPKHDPDSYRHILGRIGKLGPQVLFLSDVDAELDAAHEAGMHTLQILRAGTEVSRKHPSIDSFDRIDLAQVARGR